jgi:Raf kinase inhibitor-like YbhB/YbcL family protein
VSFTLQSAAFADGDRIPARHTCDGDDVRPALSWGDPPAGTSGFLLVVEDPDAPGGTFLHYTAWELHADLRELPEDADAPAEGRNDFGGVGWRGPCPPRGSDHRYVFRLIALERPLDARTGAAWDQIAPQIRERALGEARLVGRYRRP